MTREEIIKFLKDNLQISVWCNRDGCDSHQVNVALHLCGEEISKDTDYLPIYD